MHKILSQLELKKENRKYQLILANDSPLGEVFDVLSEMRGYILQMIKDSEEKELQKSE